MRRFVLAVALLAAHWPSSMLAQSNSSNDSRGLSSLSIEALMDLQVTSVTKSPELLSHATAAIFVITQEDIHRSTATSIP